MVQKYLLRPGMDRTEAKIHQHFCWPEIRKVAQKEVKTVTLANTQNGQIRIWKTTSSGSGVDTTEQTMCRSNRYLRHMKKGIEIKFKF